jgi:hypothetical protein
MASTDKPEDCQAYQAAEISRAATRNRAPTAQPQASLQFERTVPKCEAKCLARARLRAALTHARSNGNIPSVAWCMA